MILMRPLLFMLMLTAVGFSCKKDKIKAGNTVEFYLLKTYQLLNRRCQIDPSTASLQDTAIIRNQDILEYSQNHYEFRLRDAAIQKIKTFKDNTPFAVTVDKKVIYYGFFKPSYSSSLCAHSITMDIAWTSGDRIRLSFGYPGAIDGVTIEDQRNNRTLIATLRKQGKLR